MDSWQATPLDLLPVTTCIWASPRSGEMQVVPDREWGGSCAPSQRPCLRAGLVQLEETPEVGCICCLQLIHRVRGRAARLLPEVSSERKPSQVAAREILIRCKGNFFSQCVSYFDCKRGWVNHAINVLWRSCLPLCWCYRGAGVSRSAGGVALQTPGVPQDLLGYPAWNHPAACLCAFKVF